MALPTNLPSNFQSTFNDALRAYKKRTREDLFLHPLAARMQSCDSPSAILYVLREQVRNDEEKWTNWLSPVVSAIHTLSLTLGEDVGLLLSPGKIIFAAIGVLLSTAQAVDANQDTLTNVFARLAHLFRRIETHAEISTINATKEANAKIMLALLSVLTIVTEEIKQGQAKRWFKKLRRRSSVENALQRLDKWTTEEAQMALATVPDVGRSATNEKITTQDGRGLQGVANDAGEQNRPSIASAVASGGPSTLPRNQLREEVQRWLSPPDPTTNHNMAREARLEGTAQWFLRGRTFNSWKSNGSLLWIHGKPGSGKSVLCSAIIEDIERMRKSGLPSMAYFVFDFRDSQKQSRFDMTTSLLTQLSAHSDRYCDIISCFYSAHNRGAQMPAGGVLTQCLKEMLSLPSTSPVYIIMDALDECPNIPGVPSPREEILELVKELVEARLPNLRICVTSRPEAGIRAVLEPLPSIRVSLHDEAGQKRDITEYIKAVVRSDPKIRRWKEEDKCLVINTLSERANGMFRWVSCQLDMLRRCFPPSVRRILNELPESMDETYERILTDISVTNGKQARRLLQCLTVALRPLRVEELAEVLSIDFDAGGDVPKPDPNWRCQNKEQAVLSACSSLITVVNNEDSKIVQFSHPSVKEFLTSRRLATSSELVSFYHIQLESAHTILAQACLSVLLRLDDRVNEDGIQSFPLAEYASRYWVDHARFENVAPHIHNGMVSLFNPEMQHFAKWVWIYDIDDIPGSPTTDVMRPQGGPLYYSSLCGFHALTQHLIVNRNMDVNARGGRYVTPLHASLYKGHIATARLLIGLGADVNVRDEEDTPPLRLALDCGYFEIVQTLLRNGADANTPDDKQRTPLHVASQSGDPSAVRLLLDSNAEVDAPDEIGRTPLHISSRSGDPDTVQVLLDYRADVNARDKECSTPLHLVSAKGNLDVVELLVRYGADVNAQNHKRSTPLHLALANGNRRVVEFLIRHDANANARDNKQSTPLHLASLNGDVDIVDLLLEKEVNVNALDNKRWTPLHLASVNRTDEVVRVLIKSGAHVDAQDNKCSTPLHVASRRGPPDIALLLLQHGAEPNARNEEGWTPLHVASREGAVEVVRCLLGRGADVNAGDGDRRTPLHMAVSNEDTKIVQLLIENGADPCAQDNRKRIPYLLQPAAAGGRA